MLDIILLKSLEAGFTKFRDLQTIVENCVDQGAFNTLIPKDQITHYNHTHNFNTILKCLRENINKKYIVKPDRNTYIYTQAGLDYVNQQAIDPVLLEKYMTIIIHTEKYMDTLIASARKKIAEAAFHS